MRVAGMKRSPEATLPSPSSPSSPSSLPPSSSSPLACGAARLSGVAVMAVAALALLLAVARVSPGRAPVPGGTAAAAPAAKRIAPVDAGRHEGEEAMVCGLVAATRYAAAARGRPTFLDFGAAYPGQVFQVVIWGSERARFHEAPERSEERRVGKECR